jgi:hypothetical protein
VSVSTLVEPAYRSEPAYWRSLGDEVADLAALADFPPDPEQKLGLDVLFAFGHDRKSVAFEFCVICSRQNLKTGLFKQATLGWLFLTEQRLVVWSAHEFNTAEEAHRDMAALIGDTPALSKRLKQVYSGAANKSIELKSGQRLIFKARTHTGGRGLSGDKVVLDESFALRPSHMGALLPTLSVRPDPQVVYGSSAGMAESDVLRGIRDRGRPNASPRLAYLEWCAPPGGCARDRCEHKVGTEGCALDRVENWQAANPLLGRTRPNGTGLTLEYVQAERDALPPAEFARERLGWWDEPGAAEVFGAGKWDACAGDDPPGLTMGALGVAVSMDLSHAAIVAAAQGERTIVKPLQHGPGTSWTVGRLRELQDRHKVMVVVDERGPGAPLIPHLEAAGVKLHAATTSQVLDACAQFHGLVTTNRLHHANYPELNAAVNGATTRTVGDRWAWGRRTSTSDISPLEAATLAAWWVSRPEIVSDPQIHEWPDEAELDAWEADDEGGF